MKTLISLFFVVAAFAQTPVPFYDGFNAEPMNADWSWLRDDGSLWSLNDRPGWLRLRTNGNIHQPQSNTTRSIPYLSLVDGDLFIETKIDFATNNCSGAGLMFYKDDDNFVDVMVIEVAEPDLQGVRSHNQVNNSYQGEAEVILDWRPVFLRILKSGNNYTTYASQDSVVWAVIGQFTNDLAHEGLVRCALYAIDCDQNFYFPADFDYLRVDLEANLPVGMLSFQAVPGDHEVSLYWTTGSESNVSHFEVARDGLLVAQVAATNDPTGHSYEWHDTILNNDQVYSYALASVDFDGTRSELGVVEASPRDVGIVEMHELYQNVPNPFNPETSISFNLPFASRVTLKVFNTAGREVATLLDRPLSAGLHSVEFNGSDLASGVYFYRLYAGTFTAQKKMVLLK